MPVCDFIFAGGGLAGLTLAYRLAHSPLRDGSILILDREAKTRNDRTWCFWSCEPTPFDGIVHRVWDRLRVAGNAFQSVIPLGAYQYRMIRGIDFYRFVADDLQANGRVRFVRGAVDRIEDGPECAAVLADGETYRGRYVFDSRWPLKPAPGRGLWLEQRFKGWLVETPADAFDPEAPYFMDLRTTPASALRFFYVLPYSPRTALVELVTTGPADYDRECKVYLEQVLGLPGYTATPVEGGVNPLTDFRFARRAGERVMNIGTRGGRVKPTTGFAFTRIQKDSANIVRSLLSAGHPFDLPPDSRRYRLYDSLLLDVMQQHGGGVQAIFAALFKNNPIELVLRFLDEVATPAENARLIASLPPAWFLQSLARLVIGPHIGQGSN